MVEIRQLSLFGEEAEERPTLQKGRSDRVLADFGTFKDSLRAPIHNWFRYPAGYSNKYVDTLFDECGVAHGDWVYDPFSGTGTTLLCAKKRGINGYGVEAHSFVHWVAGVKLFWEYDFVALLRQLEYFLSQCRDFLKESFVVLGDSAPYGVHIPTETLIGKLGIAIGFSTFEYIEFRTRGGKWKDNPQRHDIPLREGSIILTK